jgi:hypothetical protein
MPSFIQNIREAAVGPRAAVDNIWAVGGIDAAALLNFENRNSLSPEQIINQAGAVIGAVNTERLNAWRGLAYLTESDASYYRQGEGDVGMTPVSAEFADVDGQRGDNTGHMLPLRFFNDALDWTEEYLMMANQAQIDADLQVLADRWRNRVETDILTRLYSPVEEKLPGGGYSVGFAIGNSTYVPHIPISYNGYDFDSTYTSYDFFDGTGAVGAAGLLKKLMVKMRQLGNTGRLVAQVSDLDVDSWVAVDGFAKFVPAFIQTMGTQPAANVNVVNGELDGVPGEIFGYIVSPRGVVEMRYLERLPTGYLGLFKSGGENNPSNPLAIRLFPGKRFGLVPELAVTQTQPPHVKGLRLKGAHGIGINKRTVGVVGYFATSASAYVTPTF